MAHLEPLAIAQVEDQELLQMMAHYERTRGFVPNSIKTMARRPNIAKRAIGSTGWEPGKHS